MINNYFYEKVKNRIIQDLDFLSFYTKSGIKSVRGTEIKNDLTLKNCKCHQNSLDLYKKDNNFKIKIAWCCHSNNTITDDWFVHFLNYNKETKEYWDNTLGGESKLYNYYILNDSWIYRNGVLRNEDANNWIGIVKSDFYKRYVKWYERLFVKENQM